MDYDLKRLLDLSPADFVKAYFDRFIVTKKYPSHRGFGKEIESRIHIIKCNTKDPGKQLRDLLGILLGLLESRPSTEHTQTHINNLAAYCGLPTSGDASLSQLQEFLGMPLECSNFRTLLLPSMEPFEKMLACIVWPDRLSLDSWQQQRYLWKQPIDQHSISHICYPSLVSPLYLAHWAVVAKAQVGESNLVDHFDNPEHRNFRTLLTLILISAVFQGFQQGRPTVYLSIAEVFESIRTSTQQRFLGHLFSFLLLELPLLCFKGTVGNRGCELRIFDYIMPLQSSEKVMAMLFDGQRKPHWKSHKGSIDSLSSLLKSTDIGYLAVRAGSLFDAFGRDCLEVEMPIRYVPADKRSQYNDHINVGSSDTKGALHVPLDHCYAVLRYWLIRQGQQEVFTVEKTIFELASLGHYTLRNQKSRGGGRGYSRDETKLAGVGRAVQQLYEDLRSLEHDLDKNFTLRVDHLHWEKILSGALTIHKVKKTKVILELTRK